MTGLLLMGAVILGFMWLNQPKPQPDSPYPPEELNEQQKKALAVDDLDTPADTLSGSELSMLAAAIKQYGVKDTVDNRAVVRNSHVNLVSDGSTVSGQLYIDSTVVSLSEVTAGTLSPALSNSAVALVKSTLRNITQYQGFAPYLQGEEKTIKLENEYLSVDFSNKGGVISRAVLKKYDSYRGGNVEMITPEDNQYSFILTSVDREFDTRDFYFESTKESDTTVVMTLKLDANTSFGMRYTLLPGSYVVRLDIEQNGMQSIIPSSVVTMDFLWSQNLKRQEAGRMFEERNSGLYYMFPDGDVKELSNTSNDDKEVNERIKWIGYKNQFFSTAFIARNAFNRADFKSTVLSKSEPEYLKEFETVTSFDYNASNPNPASFDILIAPNLYPMLSKLDDTLDHKEDLHLTRLIPLGLALFRWINTWIVIPLFTLLGHWFTNYGIIILVLTIVIKIILFPFTYKSYMSQAKMRLLAPEIKEINEKYPGQENAMVRQQKTMKLYSDAGANPMSGCLPMLLQMPVLIALFTFFPSAIELRGEPFLWVKDLSAPDAIISWSTHIPLVSEYFGNHISLFCLLMTVTNIIYMKLSSSTQMSSATMPGMKAMMYIMPLMFLVFFNNYAAGLSYYYFLSLLITIVQTYVFRHVVSEEKMRAKMQEAAKKPKKKSGFYARLEEAQRKQQAMLREQQKNNKRR